ncbi:glycosyltransferase family 4 protein [Haladaptatus sp. CMAA 1911]|uniref:glycosyltransferase family 4 protein n=1 Tax=unclassified Haladaptatus TaxID=2622732 RepID=UPI00375458DA
MGRVRAAGVMRLGFVVYGSLSERSGGFRYDRKLVEGLRSRGHDVSVVGLPWDRYAKSLCHNLADLESRLSGFDAVLEDHLCHPSLLRANRALDVPVVAVVHHLRSSEPRAAWKNACYRGIERQYLRGVDAAVCNSQTTRRSVKRLRNRPTTVAYPAGDRFEAAVSNSSKSSNPSKPSETRSVGDDTDGPLRLLFLGNLIERKGVHVLLSALATVSGDWTLTVVGARTDAEYAARLHHLRNRLGLRESVRFTGRLSDEEAADHLARSHVLVGPSLYEGLGLVYLEAMAFGLPAIATTAGGASEIVSDGETGLLCPPDDADTLADAVRTLRDDPNLRRRMGDSARERYENHPSWEETTTTVVRFLDDVTDPTGAVP